MAKFTKEQLIEDLKSSTQNDSGMFEIGEDTICALMSMLTNAAPQLPQPAVAITQHFDTIALDTAKMVMCDVNRRDEFLGGDIQLLSRIQCRIDEACRAAMLQVENHTEQHLDMVDHSGDANENGKDVTLINEGNIPAMQIKPVADLYSITSPTGSETTFTFDASEASSFVGSGWSVQEYVELERYQEAITGK